MINSGPSKCAKVKLRFLGFACLFSHTAYKHRFKDSNHTLRSPTTSHTERGWVLNRYHALALGARPTSDWAVLPSMQSTSCASHSDEAYPPCPRHLRTVHSMFTCARHRRTHDAT